MGVAYKDGYYYLSSGGSPNKPIGRFNEDLEFVDSYTFPLDSRGLVLNPGDGELYARSYAGGIYRVNTDSFDGSIEYVNTFSTQMTQAGFTFSSDGASIYLLSLIHI